MGWGISQPFSDVCLSGTLQSDPIRVSAKLRQMLGNSEAIYGSELRPLDSSGNATASESLASKPNLRNEGHANYLTCQEIGDVIEQADILADEAWTMNAGCNPLQFNCQCNSKYNALAHMHVSAHLKSALSFSQEDSDIQDCLTVETVEMYEELYDFVGKLWAEDVDVEADNRKLVIGMVATSAFFIGGLLLMTKKR